MGRHTGAGAPAAVTTAAQGSGPYYVSGNETAIAITDNYTSLTLGDLSNDIDKPFVFLQTVGYKRVRIPNGASSSSREWMNLQVDNNSLPVRFEAETANTDGTRDLLACLGPGAYGAFQWDGTEWFWDGVGEIPGPVLKNDPGAWIAPVSGATVPYGFAYYEDATGPGVVTLSLSSVSGLAARCVPINVDGSMGTPGTAATFKDGANALSSQSITALSDTIFIVHYAEATTNHVRAIVLTRTAGSTSLTFASTAGSTIMFSGGGVASRMSVTAFRGDDTKFLWTCGWNNVDAAYHPEISYCTIASTGVNAAITRNTAVTFRASDRTAEFDNVVVEDPDTDGLFWTYASNTTNANAFLVSFTISGTTPTRSASYAAPHHTATNSDDCLVADHKDGNIGVYQVNTYSQMTMFDHVNFEYLGGTDVLDAVRDLGRRTAANIDVSGIFGGVISSVPRRASQGVTYRFSKTQLLDSMPTVSTAAGDSLNEPEHYALNYSVTGKASTNNTASIQTNARHYGLHLGNSGIRYGYENQCQCFAWEFDAAYLTEERVKVYEIGTATRWGRGRG